MAKIKPVDEWTRSDRDAARAVLLEASPYLTDGGELIGRDPRSISVEEFQRAGIDGAGWEAAQVRGVLLRGWGS